MRQIDMLGKAFLGRATAVPFVYTIAAAPFIRTTVAGDACALAARPLPVNQEERRSNKTAVP
jgi:hypothetical protein